ncbi:MAG: hypothetical protein NTX47_03445 [Candidatus Omnitrophica bacterium]|nr:hypothetical protein [Candidatus Omnitrophota bacterium]
MLKFNKDFDVKVISLVIAMLFVLNNIAYGIDMPRNAPQKLRVPVGNSYERMLQAMLQKYEQHGRSLDAETMKREIRRKAIEAIEASNLPDMNPDKCISLLKVSEREIEYLISNSAAIGGYGMLLARVRNYIRGIEKARVIINSLSNVEPVTIFSQSYNNVELNFNALASILMRSSYGENVPLLIQFMVWCILSDQYVAAQMLYSHIEQRVDLTQSLEMQIKREAFLVSELYESGQPSSINNRLLAGRKIIKDNGLKEHWIAANNLEKAFGLFKDISLTNEQLISIAAVFFKDNFAININLITSDIPQEERPLDGDKKPVGAFIPEQFGDVLQRLQEWSTVLKRLPYRYVALNPSFSTIIVAESGRAFMDTRIDGKMLLTLKDGTFVILHEFGHAIDPALQPTFFHSPTNIYQRINAKMLNEFARKHGYRLKELNGHAENDLDAIADLLTQIYEKRRDAWRVLKRNSEYYESSFNRPLGFWEGFIADLEEERKLLKQALLLIDKSVLIDMMDIGFLFANSQGRPKTHPDLIDKLYEEKIGKVYDEKIKELRDKLVSGQLPSREIFESLRGDEKEVHKRMRSKSNPLPIDVWTRLKASPIVVLGETVSDFEYTLHHRYSYEVSEGDNASAVDDPTFWGRLRKRHYEWFAERVRLFLSHPDRLQLIDEETYDLFNILLSEFISSQTLELQTPAAQPAIPSRALQIGL